MSYPPTLTTPLVRLHRAITPEWIAASKDMARLHRLLSLMLEKVPIPDIEDLNVEIRRLHADGDDIGTIAFKCGIAYSTAAKRLHRLGLHSQGLGGGAGIPSGWTNERVAELRRLRKAGCTYAKAADHLGVSPQVVWKKLNELGLTRKRAP